MNITDPAFGLSFEVFPPRNLNASFKLWRTIEELSRLDPSFVSVTYGAGGSTRDVSRAAVDVIAREYGIDVAGHLTCVAATREQVMAVAQGYADAGAKQIVALRGDTSDGSPFAPDAEGFQSSLELISALSETGNFKIRVAAYPHTHPDAANPNADIDMLKAKFDAGADSAITQFFFEADDFLRFRDKCADAGITQKIIPGIFPVENWKKTKSFSARCGTTTPDWLDKAFENATSKEEHDLLSTAICTELCDDLLGQDVEDLHFYTLNDPALTKTVCHALGRKQRSVRLSNVA
jgi:methylenetetrahydrofolate reductase (NADPH)